MNQKQTLFDDLTLNFYKSKTKLFFGHNLCISEWELSGKRNIFCFKFIAQLLIFIPYYPFAVETWSWSESMYLDHILSSQAFLNHKLANLDSMVSLELNNAAPLLVLECVPIAAPCFLEVTQDLLEVQIIGQAMHDCQALASGSLHEFEVY